MTTRSNHVLGAVIFLALIALGVSLYVVYQNVFTTSEPVALDNEPLKRGSFAGTYLCLPLTETGETPADECAVGILTDEGAYYAIDFGLMSSEVPILETGDRLSASGTITPLSYLSTDMWQRYPIIGIFSVTDSLVVLEEEREEEDVSVIEHPLLTNKWVWTHTTYNNGTEQDAPPAELFVLSFEAENRVTSTTDCNSIGGNYVRDGEVLSFGPFLSTKMYCEDALEGTYTQDLSLTNSFVVEEGTLRLNLDRDYGTMFFTAKATTTISGAEAVE